jgi:hypothetical protein
MIAETIGAVKANMQSTGCFCLDHQGVEIAFSKPVRAIEPLNITSPIMTGFVPGKQK